MIVMRFKKGKKSCGWYSTHWKADQVVEMESHIIAQMHILKNKEQGYYDDMLLVFKAKDDDSFWEVTNGLKLQDFLNENYVFAFIKEDGEIK